MITAKPFTTTHWKTYRAWHDDRELSRRASFPDENWFKYVSAQSVEHSIVAFENAAGDFVSLAQFDIDDQAMVLFIAVNPIMRKQGIGKATLDTIKASAPLTVASIDAHIEADNVACIHMAQSAGFQALSDTADKEGFLHWRLIL